MGTSAFEARVVYDTGSDWLVVESSTCTTCLGTNYDITTSTDSVQVQATKSERLYGSAALEGYEYTDTVCIKDASNNSLCASAFEYFLIDKQTGLSSEIDGILGMSMGGTVTGYTTGPLLVDKLQDASELTLNLFSFYLDNINGTSYVDMGYQDTSSMSNSADLYYVPMQDNFFWLQFNYGIRFGSSVDTTYKFESPDGDANWGYTTIFDTGTTLAYVPNELWDSFISTLIASAPNAYTESTSDGFVLTYCDITVWPSVWLWYESAWLEMIPNDYLLDGTDLNVQDRSVCILGFVQNGDNFWLLGDVFMRGFYSVHDMDNQKIGFVPHSNSDKQAPEPAEFSTLPDQTMSGSSTDYVVYIAIAIAILIIFVIAALV